MLYTEETARANIRTRDGKRVFFLGKNDTLTPGARDFLRRERIEIRSAQEAPMEEYRLQSGGYLKDKPEHMTHLQGNLLVRKDHPRIAFRGALDELQAQVLLCQTVVDTQTRQELQELLDLARQMIRCEVLEERLEVQSLCGLTPQQLRQHSHYPQEFYGQPHFMPDCSDGEAVLRLNQLRCTVRRAERLAVAAFVREDGQAHREDLLQALNRMSSMVYILMIKLKKNR